MVVNEAKMAARLFLLLVALWPALAVGQSLPQPQVRMQPENDNSNRAASTSYVDRSVQILLNSIAGKAPLANPQFSGAVKADALQILGTGSTGDASLMSVVPNADAAAGSLARLAGSVVARVSNLAALKSTVPATGAVAVLTDGGRDGAFTWTPGDLSLGVASDPRSAVYVQANGIPATAGAWVRQGWSNGCVPLTWFGLNYADDTVAIQAAISFASNLATKCVSQGPQQLTFSSTITVPAGLKVVGNRTGRWKQANGANLAELLTLGEGAELIDIGFDGNWTNNQTVSPSRVGIRIGGSSNTVIRGSLLNDFAGYAIVVNGGKHNKIVSNKITNFYNGAAQIYGADGYDANLIEDNDMSGGGWGVVGVANSSGNLVNRNRVTGFLIGGYGSAVYVNTSGNTATWVSGPKFTGLKKGNWLVYNNGAEARIASVVSDTEVTTETPLTTLSNTPAQLGTGDLSGIVQGSFNRFTNNFIKDTATFGFGYSLSGSAVNCSFNDFTGNTLINIGKNAVNYSATVFNGGALQANNTSDNTITLAGGGAGNGASDRIAIYLQGVGAGSITDSVIRNNNVTSYAGMGQTSYWLGTNSLLDNGSVTVQGNQASGMASDGIFGGVTSVTLSSHWGSTATATNVFTDGRNVSFTLTANGSGLAAGGSFTIAKIVEDATGRPLPTGKAVNGSGYLPTLWGENQSTRGNWLAYQRDNIAPAAGQTFEIWMKD